MGELDLAIADYSIALELDMKVQGGSEDEEKLHNLTEGGMIE